MDIIQMTICYSGGFPVAAVVLHASGGIIRVAVDGWEDAVEFKLVNGQWFSQWNEPVEIESRVDPCPGTQRNGTAYRAFCVQRVPAPALWVN